MMKKIILMGFLLILLYVKVNALIINIPADQPTIQEGINVAVDGDTVLVQPGDYLEMINFNGKNIVVGSLFLTTADSIYIDSTVIRYNINWNYVVTLENNESSEAMLIGFKIGQGGGSSKGIHCSNSSPQIKYNHIDIGGPYGIRCDSLSSTLISENLIENADRGVQISYGASPTIINNKISNVGKGILVSNSSATIIGNEIIGSSGDFSRGIETGTASTLFISSNSISNNHIGIQISNGSQSEIMNNFITDCWMGINCLVEEVRMINNTIVNNEIYGIEIPWGNQPEIINCIVWGNTTNITLDSQAFISNSCIEGGIPINSIDLGGNISRNPCFINPNANDFTLLVSSPCIEAGTIDTTGLHLPEFDLVGNDRIQDGNGDNIFIIDMGCYEAETITDPGYISGTISLLGGTGNVEDVNVGVGAPVHPDENGDYLITIGTSASPYDVTAWLENYLPQTIYGVEVLSGEITENVDFELEYYQPDTFLEFTPDSLFFITEISQDFKIKNISLIDININAITFAYITGSFYYYPYNLPFPQLLAPNDSLECIIYLDLPTLTANRELLYDSLFVLTDVGQFTVPIIWDDSLINDASDNTIQLSELNFNNYPNPFNPTTTISYSLKENAKVSLKIYNIKGQKVKTLINEALPAGEHSAIWNGRDSNGNRVGSGIYFYKLKAGDFQKVKKMILSK
jgi:parallel beta-helix repeat protein